MYRYRPVNGPLTVDDMTRYRLTTSAVTRLSPVQVTSTALFMPSDRVSNQAAGSALECLS
jgi:hypothetical protein